ncbi:hypothetical protein [Flavobacterium collinsii]|uniref:Uncharacterized protein n=1 Tax=Flavobacterium collinsii TaxID=1114861 RepID=A0A9W4TIN8_9FLAO|nr:hypothetical protein [Flavobacterium collinsii]CAI2768786.1 conserved protein of unknown function [Flavobacterium collinsii]
MRNNQSLFLSIIIFLSFVLQSCENKVKNTNEIKNTDQHKLDTKQTDSKITQAKEEVFKDIFEFSDYNDDGDYTSLFAKKGDELYSFVNDKNEDRSLLRGDICEIQWKKDTIYVAGDGETPMLEDWLISVRKIKDGNVSKMRKEYKKEFKYHWSKEDDYSKGFLDKIYLLTEYYIANSKNELLQLHIKNKEQISYSIENQKRENKDFTVMGIGYEFEKRFTIIQWLYYDGDTDKLYEYDLGNDKLNEFK